MQFAFFALCLGTLVFAWWRGGAPERLVASIYALALALTAMVSQRSFVGVDLGIFITDTMVLLALVLVTARFQKRWLIWSSALQLVTVAAHIARFTGGSVTPFGYAWIVSALSYPMLVLLAVGTWRHSRLTHAELI